MTAAEPKCATCGQGGYRVLANSEHAEYWSHYRPQKEPHPFALRAKKAAP